MPKTLKNFPHIKNNLWELNRLCPFYLFSKDKDPVGYVQEYIDNVLEFKKVLKDKKGDDVIKKVPIKVVIIPLNNAAEESITPTAFAKVVTNGVNGNFREVCFIKDTVDGTFKKIDELQCLDVLRGKKKFCSNIIPEKFANNEDSSFDNISSNEGSESDQEVCFISYRKRKENVLFSQKKKKEKKTDNASVLQLEGSAGIDSSSNVVDSNPPLLSQNNVATSSN